uniref:Uncharacterized protein n=1 Tax=Panagrolaimus sp. ES5 TaxID=591445 RepID=A0AC34FFM0_9BILA
MPQMEPYIIKLLFWHFNPDLVSTEHHIRLTTKDIFDISQDWLYTQAVDLFDLQLDEFHLWAYDRLANIFTLPNYVVNCSNKRKIAELPIYNNTLEIYVKKHVD